MTKILERGMGKNKRLEYIDLAKGVLILFVIIGHYCYATVRVLSFSVEDDVVFKTINLMTGLFIPFYMPAFFIISGYCSNFDKSAKDFLFDLVKKLFLPIISLNIIVYAITLCFFAEFTTQSIVDFFNELVLKGGHFWFLPALLLSKLFTFIVLKLDRKFGVLTLLCLFLFGIFQQNHRLFWHFDYACLSVVFVYIGSLLRRLQYNFRHYLYAMTVYLFVYAIYHFLHEQKPYLTGDVYILMKDIPSFFILSIVGSISLIGFCKRIGNLRFINYWGRESLILYVSHFLFLKYFVSIFHESFIKANSVRDLLFLNVSVIVLSICCSLVFVNIINIKYLRNLIGKFN